MIQWYRHRLNVLIRERNINFLGIIPILIGFLLMLTDSILFPKGYTGTIVEGLFVAFIFFFWGLAGLVIVLKREFPGHLFRGVISILLGLFLLLVGWWFSFWVFRHAFMRIFHIL